MALFKIFKGTDISKLTDPANEEYIPLKDGYCYFDTTTGLFFIDAEVVKEDGTTEIVRAPINANRAIYDVVGQRINTTYIKDLSISGKTITYTKGNGTTGTITTQDNNTTYSAGTGLSLSGTTFNHSNSVTAATAQGDASKTLTFGGTFTIPTITYDAQGHITGKGTTTMTMPANPNVDTKVIQTATTSNASYPLLLAPKGQTTTTTTTSYFDSGVTLNPSTNTITANISGNAATATKLDTARTISLTGSVTGSGSFDGSGNLSIATTTNHTHNYAGSSSAGGGAKKSESYQIGSTTETYGDQWQVINRWISGDRLKIQILNNGAIQNGYPVEVDHAYKLADPSTEKNKTSALLSKGSATQPVYFSEGVPVACSTLNLDTSGNAATASKVNNNLTIKLNSGTTEDTNLFTFNGSTAKTINITPAAIGASISGHTHLYAGSESVGGPANSVKESLSFAVGGVNKGSYNGSQGHKIEINAIDLNISSALRYIGRTNNKPEGRVITLVSGNQVTAERGNVVIWTEGNIEYLLDDDYTWVQLGEASSFALAPHIHGNISNQGYITDEEGNSLSNRILISDGTGYIEGGIEISNNLTGKFLNENGTWQSVNTDNFYHSTGAWSGADSLTYTATANGGAPALAFTLPTASTSAKGVIKAGNNISISQGTISITKENVESALGFTPLANTVKYALSDSVGGDALVAKKLATARTINGMQFNGAANVNNYGVCETAAETVEKIVTVDSTFSLAVGAQVVVKFTHTNTIASPTLNVNGTGAKPIYRYGTTKAGTSSTSSSWASGAVQRFTYDGTGWIMDYWYNSTYYTTDVTCTTAAATAAKVGSTSYYTLANNRYFIIMLAYSNTAASALTLNINSNGAKPIYINGSASSESNYTLPRGIYLVYYNGTNYYFRTDGGIQGGNFYGTASTASTASKTTVNATTSNTKYYIVGATGTGSQSLYRAYNSSGTSNTTGCYFNGASGVLYGAAWNDYAEYRITKEEIEPGRCVIENGDDTLSLSTARLQRGCEIVSDTFGFAIGETEESKTPIAATGRVLCYLLEGREVAKSHIGWPVCSGPNGTVSIMTEEEEEKYPSRIIGTISAVPDYEEWGSGNVKVNGRIWIRIK